MIILRAVFYRTRRPHVTLQRVKSLLALGGEIALLDPCPCRAGAHYFFRKQFPQGQFYIIDADRYLQMIRDVYGLVVTRRQQIYGQPAAPLKEVRLLGNVVGVAQLATANLMKIRPYTLSYTLRADVAH